MQGNVSPLATVILVLTI